MLKKLMKNDLVKSGGAYTIATFALKGVNFFTIPLFTHILTVEQYGFVNNFAAWVSVFSIFIGLNLNAAINNAIIDFKDKIKNFLSSVLLLATLVFAIVVDGSLVGLNLISSSVNRVFLLFVLLQSFVTFVINFQSTYLMIQNKYLQNILVSFLSTIFNVFFSVTFMLTIFSLNPDWGRVIGSTVGLVLLAIPLYLNILLKGGLNINFKYWKFALVISVPLLPHAVGNFVLSQFDRIIIQQYRGDVEVGLYSFVYNVATIISVIWMAANNAWVPWFFKKFSEDKKGEITKTTTLFISLFMIVTMIVMPISVDLARYMGTDSYQAGIFLIMPVTLAYFFQFLYGFPVNAEFVLKKTGFIGISTAVAAVINVVINLWLVPKFGYVAAGFSTLFTYLILMVGHFFMAKKLLGYQLFKGIRFTIAGITMTVYSAIQMLVVGQTYSRYMVMIGGIFIVLLYSYNMIRRYKE